MAPRKPSEPVVEGEIVDAAPAPAASPAKKAKRPRAPKKSAADTQAPETDQEADRADRADDGAGEKDSSEREPAAVDEIEPDTAELEDVSVDVETTTMVPARARSVESRDPLAAYMAEVTKHPLLTREEEISLAKRYRESGDVRAAYKLVASNLRLVVKLAHEYHRNPIALLDLVQEGNIGLMQAVKKFDPERGVKLASYAAWWIRAYILRYIMDNWKMVKIGTTEAQRKLFFKLRQEQDRLAAQGFELTPKLLAERLNVTEQDVVEMDQRLGHDEMSLDAPAHVDDEKNTRGDRLLPSGAPSADDTLGNAQLRELFKTKLAKFSESLNEKERYIFEHRLISDEPMTLQDIGAHYGFSRERARQLEAALIDRMRKYMQQEIPDFQLMAAEDHD